MTVPSPPCIKLPASVAGIYRAVAELERLYPDRKFTPDGHLVGSFGEVIAAEHFGLTLHSMSKPGHDAVDAEGREAQIKLTAGNSVSLYADCERLIVLRIITPEQAEIVYDGPGAPIWAAAGSMQKTGQRTTPIHELERYMRCKDCSQVRGYAFKRSHLVALRTTKITASDPPST